MCSMLDIQAAWSAWLCCGPSGSRWNWSVVSEVGGSKPTGTNSCAVMSGTVVEWQVLAHSTSFSNSRFMQGPRMHNPSRGVSAPRSGGRALGSVLRWTRALTLGSVLVATGVAGHAAADGAVPAPLLLAVLFVGATLVL